MKNKIIFLFLTAGIIIYTFTVGTSSVSNIFLILIYIYLLSIIKSNEKRWKNNSQNKDDLLNIINNIPIPAFLKDLDNNIIAANKECFNLVNCENNEDYKTLKNMINNSLDKDIINQEEKELILNKKPYTVERTLTQGKISRKYQVYKSAICNRNKIEHIAVFFKITEPEDKNTESNKDIIATLTHDLKTPAVAQIRAIELLLNGNFGEINDNQRSFLNDILGSCNNMLDMLINMLWLYKFDNKRVAINLTSFDINELIKEIFNENKLILDVKNYKFAQNNKTAKIHILADKMHIKRIISNLLINAVNHSKENSTIYIETNIENNNFIFKVTNQGNHLSEDFLKCIIDKDTIFNQKCDGLSTGLGLYLSNSLLKLNGGKFIYNSQPNGENTFGFMLNLCPNKYNEERNQITTIK